MGSCAREEERLRAEVGALIWVCRQNGTWWPGQILGMDELPENCVIPRRPGRRPTCTPIRLLGRPNGKIVWYNLEKSKRLKPFRCGEFDECIEKAKSLAFHDERTQTEGIYVRREDAIWHALEIEMSHIPYGGHWNNHGSPSIEDQIPKLINQTTEYNKGVLSIQDDERMGSSVGEEERLRAEVGALVWVCHQTRSWWPGQILDMDELPENCVIPRRSTATPIRMLGYTNGEIGWYNLEKSKCLKPFRCGEFDECIEKAKSLAFHDGRTQTEGSYVRREDAIWHALEIEMSHIPNGGHLNNHGSGVSIEDRISKLANQTAEYNKEGVSSIEDDERFKIRTISSSIPMKVQDEGHKNHNCLFPQQDGRIMECHALDSDAIGLHATAGTAVCEPSRVENNVQVYDIEEANHENYRAQLNLAFLGSKWIDKPIKGCPVTDENSIHVHDIEVVEYGNYTHRKLPLAFLRSRCASKSIKGYPVTVEVLDDCCSAASRDDHCPAGSSLNCTMLPKSKTSATRRSHAKETASSDVPQLKSWGNKRIWKHNLDKWQSHADKPASSHVSQLKAWGRKRIWKHNLKRWLLNAEKIASAPSFLVQAASQGAQPCNLQPQEASC